MDKVLIPRKVTTYQANVRLLVKLVLRRGLSVTDY